MTGIIHFVFLVFTGFFAIMNPIANTPIFIGLSSDFNDKEKRYISLKACTIAFLIVAVFVVTGKYIFEMFGISIPAFKITGGILIFYVGFEMLQAKKSSIQHNKKQTIESHEFIENSLAVSPLAIPILAGPGTIVTAMNFAANGDVLHILLIICTFAVLLIITHMCFTFSDKIVKIVGHNVLMVIGKVMGLILAIIGTGMVIDGIELVVKSFT